MLIGKNSMMQGRPFSQRHKYKIQKGEILCEFHRIIFGLLCSEVYIRQTIKKIKTKGRIFHSDNRVRLPGAVPDKETFMVKLIVVVIAFVGLLDYALLVASSMWEDEETYMRRHKDETD